MKAETQAVLLEQLMQKHYTYCEYELALPLFKMKHSVLKSISLGDIILLGLSTLECILISADTICAKATYLDYNGEQNLTITQMNETLITQKNTEKYKITKCVISLLQIKALQLGHTIRLEEIDFDILQLYVDTEAIAEAKLVEVDHKLALEVTKVLRK